MNQYFRPFTSVPISAQDIQVIRNMMSPHRDGHALDYHGYLDLKTTLRTSLSKNLNLFAKKLDLKIAGIYAFTAIAGSVTLIHIDGDLKSGPLPWRLSYYVNGEPGTLSWHETREDVKFCQYTNSYICDQTAPVIFSRVLDTDAAFVRTDVPHKLDISNTTTDRLTITATFLPKISWEELNRRLDCNGY